MRLYLVTCFISLCGHSCRSSPWDNTPLHSAAVGGKLEIAKLLVEMNAELDPNSKEVLKILTPVFV